MANQACYWAIISCVLFGWGNGQAATQAEQTWKVEDYRGKGSSVFNKMYSLGECVVLTRKDMRGLIAAASKVSDKPGWMENSLIIIRRDKLEREDHWQSNSDGQTRRGPQGNIILERCADHVNKLPIDVQELLAPYMIRIPRLKPQTGEQNESSQSHTASR